MKKVAMSSEAADVSSITFRLDGLSSPEVEALVAKWRDEVSRLYLIKMLMERS